MSFDTVKKYQKNVIKLLDSSFKKNRLVHTYLFVGSKGSLKKEAALYLASLLLCETNEACGECKACKQIRKGTNPNVFLIAPETESIKKEQILTLEHEFSMTSSSKRIFIIEHIDKATIAGVNSLLKFLEDANENCYGILLTENINAVIPTIRSRSQIVNFLPISRNNILDALWNRGIPGELSQVISTLTNDLDEALELAANEVMLRIIELVKSVGMSIEEEEQDPYLVYLTQSKFLTEAANKEYYIHFLNIFISLQHDKMKWLLYQKEDIVFEELLEQNQIQLTMAQEIQILEIILSFKAKIGYSINMELSIQAMMIEIVRCANG